MTKNVAYLMLLCVLLIGFGSVADVPDTVNVHGQLVDSGGTPLTGDRVYSVQFYDAETAGATLGGAITGTTALSGEGLFNIPVQLPAETLTSLEVWYELAIDTDSPADGSVVEDTFPERFRVHSVPFTQQAAEALHVDAENVGDGDVDNTELSLLDGVTANVQIQIDTHTGDTNNPHGVDAADVGLGNVDNTADLDKPVSTATQAALDSKSDDTDLVAHAGNTNNPHMVTAAQVGLDQVDNTADLDKPVSTATQTALDVKADVTALDGKVPYANDAFIIVETTDNVITNGNNLRAAYAAAAALTSSTTRAVVIVPPGDYDLRDGSLVMDEERVDIIGLSTARDDQYLYRSRDVLIQTASDVRIENLVLRRTSTSTTAYAYYPDVTWSDGTDHTGSPPETVIRNCEFLSPNENKASMRDSVEYAGLYKNCLGEGSYSFGGNGVASGTFINCTGGLYAFGYNGTASGSFNSCTGGELSFGGRGNAEGTFTNCMGDNWSFGADGTASGTFISCTGGFYAFGYNGTASGSFKTCTGGTSSFGGNGTASGDFMDCCGGARSFGGYEGTASGIFINCTGGYDSFGGNGGTASGTFTNCIGGSRSFGTSGGIASGTFTNCVGGDSSFGSDADGSSGTFVSCVGTGASFTSSGHPTSSAIVGCIRNGALYPGWDASMLTGTISTDRYSALDDLVAEGATGLSITEVSYLDGVSSPIQGQLAGKAYRSELTAHTTNTSNPHMVTAAQLGLGNVDNTADADKPISTAQQTVLDAKANDAELTAHTTNTSNPHMVTAAHLGLGNVDNTTDMDKPVSTATRAELDGKLPYSNDAYVIVETTDSAVTNADNLRTAYTAAKGLTPNGAALSITNRATVIVPPGVYNLGTGTLLLDQSYVDIVGLSTVPQDQRIYSGTTHTLTQEAADVCVENLQIHYTGTDNAVFAYYPDVTWNDGTDHTGSPPETIIRNCIFRLYSHARRSMRTAVEYAGWYEDCSTNADYAFGGGGGIASGTFINCTADNESFGADGTASGTFKDCTADVRCFGGGGIASGIFTNCTAGYDSFGYFVKASGTFTRCTAGDTSFGAFGTASGTFTNCTSGVRSFGYGGTAPGGKFYHCVGGGTYCFTKNAGTGTTPVHLFCIKNNAQYSGND